MYPACVRPSAARYSSLTFAAGAYDEADRRSDRVPDARERPEAGEQPEIVGDADRP